MPELKLIDEVNKSGFPFQIAVENYVKCRTTGPRWRVVASEVPWSHGYVDLVARSGSWVAIIECKRVQDQSWVFLADQSADRYFAGVRALYHRRWYGPDMGARGFRRQVMDIDASWCEPSYQASYCVLTPTKDKRHRELESVAGEVVAAASELADGPEVHHETTQEVFIPVVVTTANLAVCRFKAGEIDLSSGTISSGVTEDVDMVRFRKPLARDIEFIEEKRQLNLGQLAARRERTVFIVTPAGFERFLFGVRKAEIIDPYDPKPQVLA